MQITITARHFDLTNAIRDHVYESSEKMEKYFDHIINTQFVLSFENNMSKVELLVHAPKNNLVSEAEDKDMYLAVDSAIDKMVAQIKKLKEKWADHQKKTSLKDNSRFVYANLIKKNEAKSRIKVKRILAEDMLLEEAIERFDVGDDPYFVFKNIETDEVNVLIKKDEEHYKLIEP